MRVRHDTEFACLKIIYDNTPDLTLSNKMYFVHFQKRTYILKIQSALMLKSYSYGVENP